MTVRAVSKRCPVDSTRMTQTTIDGVAFWVCPVCGYLDPVM